MIDLSTKTYMEPKGPTTWLAEVGPLIIAHQHLGAGDVAAGAIPAVFGVRFHFFSVDLSPLVDSPNYAGVDRQGRSWEPTGLSRSVHSLQFPCLRLRRQVEAHHWDVQRASQARRIGPCRLPRLDSIESRSLDVEVIRELMVFGFPTQNDDPRWNTQLLSSRARVNCSIFARTPHLDIQQGQGLCAGSRQRGQFNGSDRDSGRLSPCFDEGSGSNQGTSRGVEEP